MSCSSEPKKMYLESLGHDILVNHVFPYLSEKDIMTLAGMSSVLHNYANDPAVWHDLYFKTFGMQPNPFTEFNWPEMYRWRRHAALYTWGEGNNGRLGYNILDGFIPQEALTPERFPRGVSLPQKVPGLDKMVISDVVTGGYWTAILTATGDIYGIGELGSRPWDLPDYSGSNDNDRSVFDNLRQGGPVGPVISRFLWPFRVGGVIDRGVDPAPDLGVGNNSARNFPLTPHRPRIDRPAHLSMPQTRNPNEEPDDEAQPFTSNIVLPGEENMSAFTQDQVKQEKGDNDGINYQERVGMSQRINSKFLETLSPKKVEFVGLGGGGRTHLLGLDKEYNVWVWDKLFNAPGTKVELDFNQGVVKPLKINKLAAAWNCNAALVDGKGLVVWWDGFGHSQLLAETKKQEKDWKRQGKTGEVVQTTVVPLTDQGLDSPDRVVDFHAGDKFIIYATASGKLYRVRTNNRESIVGEGREELKEFQSLLQKEFEAGLSDKERAALTAEDRPKFDRVRGGYKFVAALSNSDHVVYADALEGDGAKLKKPEAPAILQNAGCISVAAGDHHLLALLRGGRLMSWGMECQKCGDLGLGGTEAKSHIRQGEFVRGDFIVKEPVEVKTPGKVVAIAAGGWQSSAIITTDIDEEN
ncbi:uncharacterized protein SAPINGB_P003964 [Magnusiomyces paraingens]|uniref:F-box domain-containing protein n=1 Tax=Magnusiomyces paraingens TaxID=2606893 RepID=A0A5E8BZH1_9ASCO|nr:uncharacterized protein SAPINGB_P003964 [Saprochaete ingens]VVT54215.1 unnamed protein product [Saprochaete ingens]